MSYHTPSLKVRRIDERKEEKGPNGEREREREKRKEKESKQEIGSKARAEEQRALLDLFFLSFSMNVVF